METLEPTIPWTYPTACAACGEPLTARGTATVAATSVRFHGPPPMPCPGCGATMSFGRLMTEPIMIEIFRDLYRNPVHHDAIVQATRGKL